MAKISKDDVLKLAKLSQLELSEEQLEKFTHEIDKIVGYVDQLQSVDVEGLEPTLQVTGLTNVTRPDEVKKFESTEELLKNTPAQENNQIKVKRVLWASGH